PMETPISLKGRSRLGPTYREAVLMHAVARLALHPVIPNIQTSWVKLGPEGAAACLDAGCNDMGGTLMNESISRAAGASFGQEMPPENMEALIRSLGRTPKQRTTLYRDPPADRIAASFAAAPLSEPINTLGQIWYAIDLGEYRVKALPNVRHGDGTCSGVTRARIFFDRRSLGRLRFMTTPARRGRSPPIPVPGTRSTGSCRRACTSR